MNNALSSEFTLGRGVRQGSVLSPSLFLIVIDDLLKKLADLNQGVEFNGHYTGTMGHADDLQSITSTTDALHAQAEVIVQFVNSNFLKLNTSKCELLISSVSNSQPEVNNPPFSLKPSTTSKCLETWWSPNLSPKVSIEKNIANARRAFFGFGALGAFQGKLSPLSSKMIVEACVVPVCLSGCTNWILTDSLLELLECFQAELGRRALKLSRFHNKLSPLIGLRWPTMRARILSLKLSFLANLLDCTSTSLSSVILRSALESGEEEVALVQQCRFLEEPYKSKFTDEILQGQSSLSSIKKDLIRADQSWLSNLSSEHSSLRHLVSLKEVPWCKIWDVALDRGYNATLRATKVFSYLSWPLFGDRQCHFCDQSIPTEQSRFEHISLDHLSLEPDTVISSLQELSDPELFDNAVDSFFDFGYKLHCLRE